MRKIRVFNFITLDGYFEGPNHDISWHRHGVEETEYAAQMLALGSVLLFGRITSSSWLATGPRPMPLNKTRGSRKR